MKSINNALNDEGFLFAPSLVDINVCLRLASCLEISYGSRNARHLIDDPAVHKLILSPSISHHVQSLLGAGAFAFKATLFDKSSESNWLVAWHQDLSIPVISRVDIAGYTGWSIKDGVHYVQPPVTILNNIIALRIHLDDCHNANGALRVLAGSHLLGRIPQAAITQHASDFTTHVVSGDRGSALFMHPLLIHASSKATDHSRRRVLHIEFANAELAPLPLGLDWHRQIRLCGNR